VVLLCAVGGLGPRPGALLKRRPQIDDKSREPLTDERGPATKSPIAARRRRRSQRTRLILPETPKRDGNGIIEPIRGHEKENVR